jgi:transglycosylase-like protein
MAFSTLAEMVQHYESGGDYTAHNPTSTASGAYQFTNPTWKSYATMAGVDTSAYPTAASAPPYLQDKVFSQAVSSNGLRDWTCPGCNPALTSYVSNNPDAMALPVNTAGAGLAPSGTATAAGGSSTATGTPTQAQIMSGDQSTSPDTLAAAEAATPGVILEEPATVGLSTGLAGAVNSWIGSAESAVGTAFKNAMGAVLDTVGNLFVRAGLIIVGVVILALALWRILDPGGQKTMTLVREAGAAAA